MSTNLQRKIEHTGLCPFGLALVQLRKEKEISQSRLSILGEFNVTNLRRVEKGLMQPGISIAVRLVLATGTDIDIFFNQLAEKEKLILPKSKKSIENNLNVAEATQIKHFIGKIKTEELASAKSPFGLLFSNFRRKYQVSQKIVAEFAQYDARNILNIEKGKQDPGVMHALAMTCAVAQKTDIEIDVFFKALQLLVQTKKIEHI